MSLSRSLPIGRFGVSRPEIVYGHDVIMAGLSFALALFLRLGDEVWSHGDTLVTGSLLMALIAAGVFRVARLYRGAWYYASLKDLVAIGRAAGITILLFLLVIFLVNRSEFLPRTTLLINWFSMLILLGGSRCLYRVVKDWHLHGKPSASAAPAIPVLLLGAGDVAALFITSLTRASVYRPVGILTEEPFRVGQEIHGVQILGTVEQFRKIVHGLEAKGDRPQKLVLCRRDVKGPEMVALLDAAETLGMALARVPHMAELKCGTAATEILPVAMEDLLGRPQKVLDRAPVQALLAGSRVLVSGAGGTIGGELARQIAQIGPSHLSVIENSELALYTCDLELRERFPDLSRTCLLADVRDRAGIMALFKAEQPDYVFHAAALKHVPIVESQPIQGVLTNVMGSRNVADACVAAGVQAMVLISTDKAVNPTSIMGVTKRIAETYCQSLDLEGGATRFLTVRFGNVLGSTGSVIPLFRRQLLAGGPLTVTHPEVVRFFMTVREAVELVLQAAAMGMCRGYQGKICVLDMGEPVRIMDLARQMIRLAGLRPHQDVDIEVTGLRPGEKLYEEIFHDAEPVSPSVTEGILLASPRPVPRVMISGAIDRMVDAAHAGDGVALLALMRTIVPEYAGALAPAQPGAVAEVVG